MESLPTTPLNNGLLPKDVTGVADFIRDTGQDGKGVIVAILDTGVDPGAHGMSKTSDGKVKIIDMIDCCGDGDVEMGPEVECNADGTLKGLSGRSLKFGEKLAKMCPTGKFRLGVKRAWDLWPEELVDRRVEEREKLWRREWRAAVEAVRRELKELEEAGDDKSAEDKDKKDEAPDDDDKQKDADSKKDDSESTDDTEEKNEGSAEEEKEGSGAEADDNETSAEDEKEDDEKDKDDSEEQDTKEKKKKSKKQREKEKERAKKKEKKLKKRKERMKKTLRKKELKARLEYLTHLGKHYDDPGPVFDCVTFHDGETWRAIVDITEKGILDEAPILENYREKFRFATFSEDDRLNYCVNIYDDGKLLSIVVDTDYHGTHVAGIVGAYFPERPELNGLAPGCQIVSLKISDSRLNGAETHQALTRAMACMMPLGDKEEKDKGKYHKVKADVVNLSFGEFSFDPEKGRFMDIARELVREHNIMFFSSAGNGGPGLSTVCAPGGMNDAIIGVGAYVTKDMAVQAYQSIDHLERSHKFPEDADSKEVNSQSHDEKKEVVPKDSKPLPNGSAAVAAKPEKNISKKSPKKGKSKERTEKSSKESKSKENSHSNSKRVSVEGLPYTWSSRGPSPSGHYGVSICAPGGAISPVSQWMLQSKMLLHGTSMASPSAAGAVAVLISYLRSKSISYTTSSLRTAIQNTALPLTLFHLGKGELSQNAKTGAVLENANAPFGAGYGSLYIPDAAKYMENSHAHPLPLRHRAKSFRAEKKSKSEKKDKKDDEEFVSSDFNLEVMRLSTDVSLLLPNGSSGPRMKGIYLRRTFDSARHSSSSIRAEVSLDPFFDLYKDKPEAKEALINLDAIIYLQATETWVTCPEQIILMGDGQHFTTELDISALESGVVSSAEIQGYVLDKNEKRRGPVLRVPITVVIGEEKMTPLKDLVLNAGAVVRKFINPPSSATSATVEITAAEDFGGQRMSNDARKIIVQLVQVDEHRPISVSQENTVHCSSFDLKPGDKNGFSVPVLGGVLLEVCIAQEWSNAGKSILASVDYSFGGLTVSSEQLHAPAGFNFPSLSVSNRLGGIVGTKFEKRISPQLCPGGYYYKVNRTIAPTSSKISPLGFRDRLPQNRQMYSLKLEYSFEVEESIQVGVRYPSFLYMAYNSAFEGGPFVMVFDEHKRFMGAGDIYPFSEHLDKGKYVMHSQIRHEDVAALEKLKKLPVSVVRYLDDSIDISAYSSQIGAALTTSDEEVWGRNLEVGERANIWFDTKASASASTSNKWAKPGDTLQGRFYVDPRACGATTIVKRPYYSISCDVAPTVGKKSSSDTSKSKDDSSDSSSDSGSDDEDEKDTSEDEKENTENDEDKSAEDLDLTSDDEVEKLIRKAKKTRLEQLIRDKSWEDFDKLYATIDLSGKDVNDDHTRELLLLKLRRRESGGSPLEDVLSAADDILKLDEVSIAGTLGMREISDEDEDEKKARKKAGKQRVALIETHFRRCRAVLNSIELPDIPEEMKKEKDKGKEDDNEREREDEHKGEDEARDEKKGDEEDEEGTDSDKKDKEEEQKNKEKQEADNRERFETYIKQLERWVDINAQVQADDMEKEMAGGIKGKDWLEFVAARELKRGRFGAALKVLKGINSVSSAIETRVALLEALGWKFEKEIEVERKAEYFPSKYVPF